MFLKDNNRNKLSAMVITGSFVEGLYISTGLVRTYPTDILPTDAKNLVLTPIIRIILDQKTSLSEVIKMVDRVEQTDEVASILADLKALEAEYASLNIEEQIRNNNANLVLSDKNLVEITNIVDRVRTGITN
jgi:hypothetical protein